jgi:hypothetical protein
MNAPLNLKPANPYRAARDLAKRHRAATRLNDVAEIARLDALIALSGLSVIMSWDRNEPHLRTAMLDPNRSRCADNHMRIPMLSEILTPIQAAVAGAGVRPWADAPTEEEMHAAAMRSEVAL